MQSANVQTVGTLAAPSPEFFEAPAWKRLRYFSIVHLVVEFVSVILCVRTYNWGLGGRGLHSSTFQLNLSRF